MSKEHILIVDLEATCDEGDRMRRDRMEIIEIGAALVDLETLTLVADYQGYIKPVVSPELTRFCTELTGITQCIVDDAPLFHEALARFKAWLSENGDPIAWGSWGMFDLHQFRKDCERHGQAYPLQIAHLNLKNEFGYAEGIKRRGLKRSYQYLGRQKEMEGRLHSGRDDAVNMARLLTFSKKFGAHIQDKVAARYSCG